MRVPLTWLNELVPLTAGATAEQVAADLVRVGLEEEGIHGGEITGPLVVGRVLSKDPEPQKNGKTINWCTVDVGPEHAAADGGPRGIVCGAHNFDAGDLVVVALPGAVLPGGFAIASRKTYGHISDGMICSARELGLGEDHDGIIVLTELLGDAADSLTPGQDALALLGLDEQVVEVNVTPDRGYCFSVRGVAREYACSTGQPFTDPADLRTPAATADGYAVSVADDAPIHGAPGCDRFVTRIVRGVDPTAASPAWLRKRVEQVGMRSISLAVDVTNYVMMGLGQPMHAYDLATMEGPILVRRARPGERITTLDGVDRKLDVEDLLITDAGGARPIGIAGVMGGQLTECSETTTDILLEAAHFDPVTIARAARRHRLPSEASKRFERGVDPALQAAAAQLAVSLLVEYGGGTADPAVFDLNEVAASSSIELPVALAEHLVGVPYSREDVTGRLRDIGCQVTGEDVLVVTPPSWRPDLVQAADLVEEVARLVGYDQIPSVLPVAPAGMGLTVTQRRRRTVARTLTGLGWDEVLSYPFVSAARFDAFGYGAGDPRRHAVTLANPLSDEEPLLRTSVLQTLVEPLKRNLSRGAADLALVELGLVFGGSTAKAPVYTATHRPTDEQLAALDAAVPEQPLHVAGIACGAAVAAGVAGPAQPVRASDAFEAVRTVVSRLGATAELSAATQPPWHPGRCAQVKVAGVLVGYAGELHPRVCESLGIPARAVAFELDLTTLFAALPAAPAAVPVSPYPVVKEDVALIVDASVTSAAVAAALQSGGGELLESVKLFDVFTGEQIGEGKKSLAFALRMRAADRTLNSKESAAVRQAAVAAAERECSAQLRGA